MTGFIWSRLALAAAMGSLVLPGAGRAATPTAQLTLERCIAAQAETLHFSGAVSITAPWVTASYARGTQGNPGSAAIGPQSRFNLGSAGKMFTAVAVAQLVEAGKIRLDDPIGRHVDGLTPEAAGVSVRQLLTHSSGLGDFFTPDNLPAIGRARNIADLMRLVRSDKPAFVPGSRFQYSNTGFLILGWLVERVSGESYDAYLQHEVFGRAGMRSTGMQPAPAATLAVGMTAMPALRPGSPAGGGAQAGAQGPGSAEELPPGSLHPSIEAALRGNPAGGSYSTAQDMQRFFAALQAGRLVSLAMLREMTSPQIVAAPAQGGRPAPNYGLGFGVGVTEGHRWFGHNGGAPGVTVEATAYPEDHISMVVMSNRDPPSASLLFRQLRRVVFAPELIQTCGSQQLR